MPKLRKIKVDHKRPMLSQLTSSCQSTRQKTLLSFCHSKTNKDSNQPIQPTDQAIYNNFNEVTALTEAKRDSLESSDKGVQGINSTSKDLTKINRDPTPSSCPANIDDVMKAISNLSLKVENFGKRHSSLEQLVAEDNEVLKSLAAMRTASNIHQFAEASKYLEFFYNRNLKLDCCVASLALNCRLQPDLLLTTYPERIINSCESGTFGIRKIFSKDVTTRSGIGRRSRALTTYVCWAMVTSYTRRLRKLSEKKRKFKKEDQPRQATYFERLSLI